MSATSVRDVERRLHERGLFPIGITPRGLSVVGLLHRLRGGVYRLGGGPRIGRRDVETVLLHLRHALAAGLPLLNALRDIVQATDNATMRAILTVMDSDLREGRSLSWAAGRHGRYFSPVVCAILKSGEESGRLVEALDRALAHVRWAYALSDRIAKTLRYPLLVVCAVMAASVFLLVTVVPQTVLFLRTVEGDLPVQTQALLTLSNGVMTFGTIMPFVVIGLLGAALLLMRLSVRPRLWVDRMILSLPVIGPLLLKLAMARIAHMLALLFDGGVPLPRALALCQDMTVNRSIASGLARARMALDQGQALSEALVMTGRFPALVSRMVRIGEDSGDLARALGHVVSFYDRDVDASLDRLIAVVEPTLIILAGGFLLWIVWAVFLPLYDSALLVGGV